MEQQQQRQQPDDDAIGIGLKTVVDVEEGEMSDSASIEEITEDDFNKDEVKVTPPPPPPPKEKESSVSVINKPKTENTRVWTMQDLYSKYPTSRDYAAGLYNFAWAQAVQNKPLNQVYVMDVVDSEVVSSSASSCKGDEAKVVNVDSCDELEEGEIDLDSEEATAGNAAVNGDGLANVDHSNIGMEEKLLEEKVGTIRDALQSITVVEAEKSFGEVCSRLLNALESLRLLLKNVVPNKDALVQLLFSGIQTINSVFCSLDLNQKEQYKEIYSRLISIVISQDRPIFSPERIKEIEAMEKEKPSISTDASSFSHDGQKLNPETGLVSIADDLLLAKNNMNMSETIKPGLSSLRAKWNVAPLLDLHKDHDSDSLPSPTRESAPFFPLHKSVAVREGMPRLESVAAFKSLDVGEGMPKPEAVMPFKPESAIATVVHKEDVSSVMRPYVTEAIKAVSTYQQKFGQASFFANDRFPSPTPSEESANKENEDMTGEISSSYTAVNLNNISSAISARPTFSPTPHLNIPSPHLNNLTVPEVVGASDIGFVGSVPNSTLKASSKSRDPRLRFANSTVGALKVNPVPMSVTNSTSKLVHVGGAVGLRTNNSVEEPLLEGRAHKRQRNELTNSNFARDATTVSGSGGWLEDANSVGSKLLNGNHLMEYTSNSLTKMGTTTDIIPSTVASGAEKVPGAGTSTSSTTTALPLLLKDIAVNPTMLLNLLKMGQQQRFSSDVQRRPAYPTLNPMLHPVSNSVIGSDPLTNVPSLKSLGFGQSSVETFQVSSQGGPTDEVGKIRMNTNIHNQQDEVGKIRMKPRDPRRFLHATAQNSAEQCKTNGASTLRSLGNKDEENTKKLENQSNKHSSSQPDIARLFTNNLRNIADLVTSSQTTTAPSVVSYSSDKVDVKDVNVESDERQTRTASMPGESVADPLKSKNTWGDVEHLFEGFDDKQKAAIQRERSRRLKEQNKMFDARKLCLVLDLDHTLLNSAKFSEVDPVHDEILRKKEEQDREKPQRHLFRFPYMGMWTKLRPGVWNFLEKASKLFEMHLYTMGNKLYATEMAKILDPKGELFAGRVISRGDDGDLIDGEERVPKSKDLEGVLGMESAVVIIDDSVRVWPRNKLNLIVVERYTYFPCSRRQFGLPGPSLLEIDHDERPEDGTLASCSAVIDKIHQTFFFHRSLDEADVRNILASEQQKILGGCRILFSRVFPVGEAKPHLHPLWQTAEQFGAVCTNHIDEQVTHVVANSLGTDKVNWALSTGRFVVHPGWVEASALLYRRVNEEDFSVKQ